MTPILTEMGAMTAKTCSLPGVAAVGIPLGSGVKENDTLAVSYTCTGSRETVVVPSILVSCSGTVVPGLLIADLTPDSFDL